MCGTWIFVDYLCASVGNRELIVNGCRVFGKHRSAYWEVRNPCGSCRTSYRPRWQLRQSFLCVPRKSKQRRRVNKRSCVYRRRCGAQWSAPWAHLARSRDRWGRRKNSNSDAALIQPWSAILPIARCGVKLIISCYVFVFLCSLKGYTHTHIQGLQNYKNINLIFFI